MKKERICLRGRLGTPEEEPVEIGPNAMKIWMGEIRIVRNPMPRAVRAELMEAVRLGAIRRMPKEGESPEVFYSREHSAESIRSKLRGEIQERQALKSAARQAVLSVDTMNEQAIERVLYGPKRLEKEDDN